MKRYFLIALLMLTCFFGSAFAEAVQIDFLLAGMRDPITDEPLNGGEVYTYQSEVASNLYLDRDKVSTAENPVILDAYGRAVVFGDGIYLFIVKNASGTVVWSSDGLEYTATSGSSSNYMGLDGGMWNADGIKIKELEAGIEAEHAVNKGQLDTVESDLSTAISSNTNYINTVQDNVSSNTNYITSVQDNLDAQTFLDLTDTPSVYTSKAGYIPRVSTGETTLEFVELQTILPDVASEANPIGTASGDLSGTYPSPTVVKMQGFDIATDTPSTGDMLEYDGSEWKPATAPTGGMTRYEAFSGYSNTVTIVKGTDYEGDVQFFAVTCQKGEIITVMFDADLVTTIGHYRVLNRGGENADRYYDWILYVTQTSTSYTFTGLYVKNVIAYCK